MQRVLVIADDLTGAAEMAGVAWRAGFPVQLLTGNTEPPGNARIQVVNSDSRNCTPEEAASRIGSILTHFSPGSDFLIFKKTDSLLRGVIVPEILSVLECSTYNRALLVPANPSRNRFIRQGRYYIGDYPISETFYRSDPEFPRSAAEVRMLANDSAGEITTVHGRWKGNRHRILVPDTDSEVQIRTLVREQLDPKVLPAGGADFFRIILEEWFAGSGVPEKSEPRYPRHQCCLIGSFTGSSEEHVKVLSEHGFSITDMDNRAYGIIPDIKNDAGMLDLLRTRDRIALRSSSEYIPDEARRKKLLTELTNLGARMAGQVSFPVHFLVTGGRTASLFCRRLQWNRLEIRHVEKEGVVTMQHPGSPHFITLKPGSYPWPEKLVKHTPGKI